MGLQKQPHVCEGREQRARRQQGQERGQLANGHADGRLDGADWMVVDGGWRWQWMVDGGCGPWMVDLARMVMGVVLVAEYKTSARPAVC